ncbi:uncharacterized protein LOC136089454 [Hydra vulgaris]|uniref:Uncharacterized protein LOC136089454 n=1 Tax=Hydra vulgaris TaxID=6087 RepID=A0ABM4DAZ8_HYDVU
MNQNKYLQLDFVFIFFSNCYIRGTLQMFWNEPIEIKKGNFLGNFTIPKEYEISFEVYLNKTVTSYANIIHFTIGRDCCDYGSRIATMFYSSDGIAEINAPINGNGNYYYYTNLITLMKWIKITIKQYLSNGHYYYAVEIDGEAVQTVQNNDARSFENVQLYVSDSWHEAPPGFLRNLMVPSVEIDNFSFYRNLISEITMSTSDVIKVPLTVIFGADAIVTYIDPSIEAYDADTCIFSCLQNAKCYSLSFSQTGRVCMLYRVNIRINQNSLSNNIDWDTYLL